MERLTVNDLNKVCYDPWELCGMDRYCTKGCHEEGGCTKRCEVLKMYWKLAGYEDLEEQCIKENSWGLRMLLHKWKEFIEDIKELYEYRQLEKQGKLLKLPAAIGDKIFYIFRDCPKDYKEEYCKDHNGSCDNCHHRVAEIMSRDFCMSDIPNMDKIYSTREEAEAALKALSK